MLQNQDFTGPPEQTTYLNQFYSLFSHLFVRSDNKTFTRISRGNINTSRLHFSLIYRLVNYFLLLVIVLGTQ